MTAFLSFFIDRARTVLTGLGFLLFAGVIAYVQIPKEAEPDLQLPIVQVFVALEGVSPQDSERLLVRPL